MTRRLILILLLLSAAVASVSNALAQDRGSVDPNPLPPLANPNDPKLGARELFGRKVLPAAMPTHVVGFYAKGCIAGAEPLPINGETWQVMRLSRNRYWGHPNLIALLKRLADKAHKDAGWPGILVGDMSQPRGGPMLTGHASHQVGLDADIWLTPSHLAVIRATAQEPSVQRIFVNAAIKKALCREAKGDRGWLAKVRPMYGHDYHFHIRIKCPPGSGECESQPPPAESEGCSAGDLAYWFSDAVLHPKPPKVPPKPKPPMTMAALPPACKTVLHAPDAKP